MKDRSSVKKRFEFWSGRFAYMLNEKPRNRNGGLSYGSDTTSEASDDSALKGSHARVAPSPNFGSKARTAAAKAAAAHAKSLNSPR